MSVAVTQSCRTGLCSKSSALGLPASVEKAILVPAASLRWSETQSASCSLARVMSTSFLRSNVPRQSEE